MSAFDVNDSKSKPGKMPGFEILSRNSITNHQRFAVKTVSEVLKISEDDAFFLLKQYRWCGDHLFEAWFEGVLESSLYVERSTIDADDDRRFTCPVCLENCSIGDAAPILCGHLCCTDCLRAQISVAARDGASPLLNMTCPTEKCNRNIGVSVVESVGSPADAALFRKFSTLSYVDNNVKVRWCPHPDCKYAIARKDEDENDMECLKFHRFCWKCLGPAHSPVECALVGNLGNMKLIDWKSLNVKKCPKCSIPIQLSHGCPHMKCHCDYEFCWTCSSEWTSEHVQVFCEPPPEESDETLEAGSDLDKYYKNLFGRRELLLETSIRQSRRFFLGYSTTIKLAWFEIRRCNSISMWICAFALINRLEVKKFLDIKEEAELQLDHLISCVVESSWNKRRERELQDCIKKTRHSFDSMTTKLLWEAPW